MLFLTLVSISYNRIIHKRIERANCIRNPFNWFRSNYKINPYHIPSKWPRQQQQKRSPRLHIKLCDTPRRDRNSHPPFLSHGYSSGSPRRDRSRWLPGTNHWLSRVCAESFRIHQRANQILPMCAHSRYRYALSSIEAERKGEKKNGVWEWQIGIFWIKLYFVLLRCNTCVLGDNLQRQLFHKPCK